MRSTIKSKVYKPATDNLWLSNYPFATRNNAYCFCGYCTTYISQDGYTWNCQIDWQYWIAWTFRHEERGDVAEEKDVHQIHAEREF